MENNFRFLIGAYNNSDDTGEVLYLNGEINELIFLDSIVPDDTSVIEGYIKHKFSHLNLGPDIRINYGVCNEAELNPGEGFETYMWNTGDTTQTIQVTESGKYYLDAIDKFGFSWSDTIYVEFITPQIPTPTFCLSDSTLWNTNLNSDYTFTWSTGEQDSAIYITSEGDYYVTIEDTLGCQLTSDTLTFTEDPFPLTTTLPPDTTLCTGGSLTADTTNTLFSYEWNTGATTPSITIDDPGDYWVEVTNENGCRARDTITVSIAGDAPNLDFEVLERCVNTPVAFENLSVAADGDNIEFWEWSFSDGQTASEFSPELTFETAGTYEAAFYVETENGCIENLTQSFEILPKPLAEFSSEGTCSNHEIQFTDESEGEISTWEWDFNDPASSEGSSEQNPIYIFENAGDYAVELIITDENACADTVINTVSILPSPEVGFEFENPCAGVEMQFTNTTTIAQPYVIATRTWNFGDNTTSNNQHPSKTYSETGSYTVTLTATGSNNCTVQHEETLTVHPNPVAQFSHDNLCAGQPITFTDNSTIESGDLTGFNWIIDGQNKPGESVEHTFSSTGNKTATLTVTSEFGCTDFITQSLVVHPTPEVYFSVIPSLMVAGQTTLMDNQTEDADTYFWEFGDGTTSNEISPEHTFSDEWLDSTISITLTAENEFGCVDDYQRNFKINEANLDLAITNLFINEEDGFLNITVEMTNLGTTVIREGEFTIGVNAKDQVKEGFETELFSGQSVIYELNTRPSAHASVENENRRFVCVEGHAFSLVGLEDFRPQNNRYCVNLMDDNPVIIPPYPNPFSEQLTIQILLPQAGPTELYIVDNAGKIVKVLHPGSDLSTGLHTFNIQGTSLGDGNYHVVLNYRGKRLTSKIVKVK